MPKSEGLLGGGAGGGPTYVPITPTAAVASGTTTINGKQYTMYTTQVSSSNNQAQSVNITPPSGCSVNFNTLSVPATGFILLVVYVPTNNNGSVSVTASETNYTDLLIPICTGF